MTAERIRILAVDDDPTTRLMVSRILEKSGYEVIAAGGGHEAIDQLRRHPDITILITDWDMGDMDGIEFVRIVRREFVEPYRFIIMLTARTGSEDAIQALQVGADEFVAKPVSAAELTARVQTATRLVGVQMRDALIVSLAKLAESRDTDTGDHLVRTRTYCRLLAEVMRESDPTISSDLPGLMELCSVLHDIGKVGIRDDVLLKPGRLTPEEFEEMKRHTTIGSDTIETALASAPNSPMLQVARDIVRHHHERWDGAGYPDGLAGEAIPLPARIMSVADVYDALRSRRVYKPAMPHEQAAAIILEGRGTQFDPAVVDAFAAVAEQFRSIGDAAGEADVAAEVAIGDGDDAAPREPGLKRAA
jgi:putative two-component system response regulator